MAERNAAEAAEAADMEAAEVLADIGDDLEEDASDEEDVKTLLNEARDAIEDRDRKKCQSSTKEVYVRSYCRKKPGAKAASLSPEELFGNDFDFGEVSQDSSSMMKRKKAAKKN